MTIDYFLFEKGADHAALLEQVHDFIINAHPGIQHKIKHGIPFYSLKKDFLYLDVQKNTPLVGVIQGRQLKDAQDLLDFTQRKQIGHFQLTSMSESRFRDLLFVIQSALDYDLKR